MNINLKLKLVIINSIIVILVLMFSTLLTVNISRGVLDDLSLGISMEIDKTLSENISKAAEITQNLIVNSHNNLLRDSKIIAQTKILKNALEYGVYPRGELQESNTGLVQNYRPIRPFIDFNLIASKLKTDFYYSQNAITHIDIYDRDGNLLGATARIPEFIIEKDPEVIKSKLASYEGYIDILDIVTSDDGISFKVYQKVNEVHGLVGISSPINIQYLQDIKNITNTDIILFKGSQYIEGTIFKFGAEISNSELTADYRVYEQIRRDKEIIITGSEEYPDIMIDLGVINNERQIKKFRFAYIPLSNASGDVVGMIGLAMSSSNLELALSAAKLERRETNRRIIIMFFIIAVLSLIGAMLLIYLYASSITKPVSNILSTIKKVSSGDLECQSNVIRRDEIGELSSGINEMIISLKEIETERLKRRMSEELRDINSTLSSIFNRDELFNTLFIKISEYFTFDTGYILLREESDYSLLEFNQSLLKTTSVRKCLFNDLSVNFRSVIESNKPKIHRNIKKSPLSDHEIDSFLSLPIIFDSEIIGCIILETVTKPEEEYNIEMLYAITSEAAAALKNVEIFDKINSKTSELSTYYNKIKYVRDTVLQIHGERDKTTAIDFILNKLLELEPDCQEGKFFEYRKSDNKLISTDSKDIIDLDKHNHIHEAMINHQIIDNSVENQTSGKEFIIPVYYNEKNFGVLKLYVQQECDIYKDNKIDIIKIIVSNLALYIENYRNQELFFNTKKIDSLVNLVTGVAHEMNTPLGVCLTSISYLSTLTDEIKNDYITNKMTKNDFTGYLASVKENNDITLRNLVRTRDLINSFKKLATTEIEDNTNVYNISNILQNLVTMYREILSKSNKVIDIEQICDPDLISEINDNVLIEIIDILINNSIIHGFEDKEHGSIIIRASQHRDIISIIYSDNGSGISEDKISNIFDPFYTTKRGSDGGIGLGLYYLHTLVTHNLKGDIRCESTPSMGTSFIITFPAGTNY